MNKVILGLSVFIVMALQGCEQAAKPTELASVQISQAELQQFVKAIKENMVFVEGGDFLMGDFGPQYAPERLPYDQDQDSKPLHKVELSNFSINKFKVTNAEYQFYLKHSGLKLREKGMANKKSGTISIPRPIHQPTQTGTRRKAIAIGWLRLPNFPLPCLLKPNGSMRRAVVANF